MGGELPGESPEGPDGPEAGAEGPEGPGPEVEGVLARALGLAEELDWAGVAELLRDALSEHPDDPYVLCWLGMAERELGMEGVAYERFKRSLAANPRDPVLLATAGNALAAFDDPAAEAALRTAAILAPRLAQARWMYGAYLAREGMAAEGLDELDAALELNPDDPVIHTERGVALALLDRVSEASAAMERALEADPEDGWAIVLLGLLRLEDGDVESAASLLDEGARLRPDDVEAQLLAALSLAGSGLDARALEMLERGRLGADGADRVLAAAVEECLEEGPRAALRLLRESMGPSALRERLLVRP
jgi:tetratricopeptide (TPR) repeat protein